MDNDRFSFDFTSTDAVDVDALLDYSKVESESAAKHLSAGDFETWLNRVVRPDLAEVAAKARLYSNQPSDSLEYFLEFAKVIQYFYKAQSQKFSFLLVGQTGTGKSSTVNSLLAEEIAPVNEMEPETSKVIQYDSSINGIPVTVIDTPGLADGKRADKKYLTRMRETIDLAGGVHCVWFVANMTETRHRPEEERAIRKITRELGPEVWKRGLIVLTFADRLSDKDEFDRQLRTRPILLRKTIAKAVDDWGPADGCSGTEVAKAVPVIPVSNREEILRDGSSWLGNLYINTIQRMPSEGFGPFVVATGPRLLLPGRKPRRSSKKEIDPAPESDSIAVSPTQERVLSRKVAEVSESGLMDRIGARVDEILEAVDDIGKALRDGIDRAREGANRARGAFEKAKGAVRGFLSRFKF